MDNVLYAPSSPVEYGCCVKNKENDEDIAFEPFFLYIKLVPYLSKRESLVCCFFCGFLRKNKPRFPENDPFYRLNFRQYP